MLKYRTIAKGMTSEEWMKAIQTRPKNMFSDGNSKLAKAKICEFSIPAAEAAIVHMGKLVTWKTCPMAKECLNFCYAQVGSFSFNNVMIKHAQNLQFVLDNPFDFVEQMVGEIKRKRVLRAVRIHSSGDFFSRGYFMVWKQVMEACPEVMFYAYTKMVPMFKRLQAEGLLPANFTVIYSQGGMFDHMIEEGDRHSKIFSTMKDALAEGYIINNYNDIYAVNPKIKKIGLVFHTPITYQNMGSKAVKAMEAKRNNVA